MGYGQSSRRYGGGSSDSEGVSLSGSDDDGPNDDSIEFLDAKTESKQRSAINAKSTGATRTPAPSASSALDKAKNFLSKYSTKMVESSKKQPTSSARSRRQIEPSMDDSIDFSPDDDEESEETPKRSKQQPKASTLTAKARRSDSSDDSDGQGTQKNTPVAAANIVTDTSAAKTPSSASDDDLEESRDRGSNITNDNAGGYSNAGSDVDDDDAIASFMDESDDHDPPPFSDAPSQQVPAAVTAPRSTTASALNPPISQLSKPKYDEVDSNSEESITSKSGYVDSFEGEEDVAASSTTPKMRRITAPATKQSNASESGVYAEDDFDEEFEAVSPTAVTAAPANNTSQPAKQDITLAKAEPNFDYSMDFSEDTVVEAKTDDTKSVMPTMAMPDNQAQEARETRSPSSSSSRSAASQEDEHSGFLENSDESGVAVAADETSRAMDDSKTGLGPAKTTTLEHHFHNANELPAPASAPVSLDEYAPFSPMGASSDDDEVKPPDAVSIQPSMPPSSVTSLPNASIASTGVTKRASLETAPRSSAAVARPLSRVTIVREYEQPTRGIVEMVDASIQFTGNHAGIQADLIPDGMHNLIARPTPQASSELLPKPPTLQPRSQSSISEMSSQAFNTSSTTTAPPAPLLPTPGYSMDALRLPTATTTSIYKQQLAALQKQILLKKRETQRLVQERMKFQYSTLRGTERFLSSNRPGKLELWQALMRVDPTLSEQKAREIARLAAENVVV